MTTFPSFFPCAHLYLPENLLVSQSLATVGLRPGRQSEGTESVKRELKWKIFGIKLNHVFVI